MGLDNLDQNYYDPNGEGNNHPWGHKSNYNNWREEQYRKKREVRNFVTIQVPENSLVLTPSDSEKSCIEKLNKWLNERK